ncbi:hypothetical protein MAPG_02518 [Magnaporthiopsis poae ATCC 64411]|uniref:Uncharacterized protein n=1 Tax=Magnaporthiopsis poae (strain ATCC 64411 / 73-15) TaxID=644358 RepID=A0A0C4DRK6_MAGP6|nr:hypothetical protein MAPG_02518 [Magnaporthiopsis poae ATCC 64411]
MSRFDSMITDKHARHTTPSIHRPPSPPPGCRLVFEFRNALNGGFEGTGYGYRGCASAGCGFCVTSSFHATTSSTGSVCLTLAPARRPWTCRPGLVGCVGWSRLSAEMARMAEVAAFASFLSLF